MRIRVEPEEEVAGHPCECAPGETAVGARSVCGRCPPLQLLHLPRLPAPTVSVWPSQTPGSRLLSPALLTPVTLALVLTYPDTYPDVIPDMALEEIDEELGELRDGEAETVITTLSAVVSARHCNDLLAPARTILRRTWTS